MERWLPINDRKNLKMHVIHLEYDNKIVQWIVMTLTTDIA